jgi:hypothetical protein
MPNEEFEEVEGDLGEDFGDEFEEISEEGMEGSFMGDADEFVTEFEDLSDAARYDQEAQDELIGKLIGKAVTKSLPVLKSTGIKLGSTSAQNITKNLASDVYKWGKRLLRTRSRHLVRLAPLILKHVMRLIEKQPRVIVKKRGRVRVILNQSTKKLAKRRIPKRKKKTL